MAGLPWLTPPAHGKSTPASHTLLFFFRPSCIACVQSLAALEAVAPAFEHLVSVIGVNTPAFDRERDEASARRAVARLGLRLPVAHDASAQIGRTLGVHRLPTLILFDRDGEVTRHEGEADPRQLRRLLDQVNEQASTAGGTGPVRVLQTPPAAPPVADGPAQSAPGLLCFPTVIKPMPGAQQRWAVADGGHHQVVLLDDSGVIRARYGSGEPGAADGPADRASFRRPRGLVCSADAIYVADTGNHLLRRIDVAERRVSTVAGTGQRGYQLPPSPRDARSIGLCSPWDLELDGADIYFTNPGSRQIGVCNRSEGTVVRLAGSGEAGSSDGPARSARLTQPASLALDEFGDRLFFTDSETGEVRALTLEEHPRVLTLPLHSLPAIPGSADPAGQGDDRRLQFPQGLAWADGELLIADCFHDRVVNLPLEQQDASDRWRVLTSSADAEALALDEPFGVWAEDAERLLIVDTNNHRILHWCAGTTAMPEEWPRR